MCQPGFFDTVHTSTPPLGRLIHRVELGVSFVRSAACVLLLARWTGFVSDFHFSARCRTRCQVQSAVYRVVDAILAVPKKDVFLALRVEMVALVDKRQSVQAHPSIRWAACSKTHEDAEDIVIDLVQSRFSSITAPETPPPN